jgi:hypothetical protein
MVFPMIIVGSFRTVNQTPALSGPVGDSQNLTQMVQDSGESVFYRALGSIERARTVDNLDMSEQLGQSHTRFRIRTLTEIFEASRMSSRKRARPSTDEQLGEDEIEEQSRKRAKRTSDERSESAEGNGTWEEEVAAIMRVLEEEFQEKERQS